MKTKEAILDHLAYGLKHVDGVNWLCARLIAGTPSGELVIRIGDEVLTRRPSFRVLQNALAEAGLIYCRKLLDFLGLKIARNGGSLIERSEWYDDDTVGIEDLLLSRITRDSLVGTTLGPTDAVREACEHTIRAANKGVAHFTEDRGERAQPKKVLLCGRLVVWLVEENVYKLLDEPMPDYKVWTAG